MYILRASKTVNGQKIFARDYGKKAFKIWIEGKKNDKPNGKKTS